MQGLYVLLDRCVTEQVGAYPRSAGRVSAVGNVGSTARAPMSSEVWPALRNIRIGRPVPSPRAVGHGEQPGVQPALAAGDAAPVPPVLRRRLAAVRCAFRGVGSIIGVSCSRPCAPGSIRIRAKTPNRLLRIQRLQSVLGGPQAAGASLQRNPLRLMRTLPLGTRRWSPRGFAVGQRKYRPEASPLRLRQPERIAHAAPPRCSQRVRGKPNTHRV